MAIGVERRSLIELTVVGHQHYGLLFRTDSGERGYVDSMYISDQVISADEWPAVGTRLTGVVITRLQDGRISASVAPRDVALIRSLDHPSDAFAEWSKVRHVDVLEVEARERFYRSKYAIPLLRWAWRDLPGTDDHKRAEKLLSGAPQDVRDAVLGDRPEGGQPQGC